MLDGDVQILDDLGLLRNGVDQLLSDLVRIQIVEPDPVEVQPAQLPQERRQLVLAVQVRSIPGDILGDDQQLLHAGVRQLPGLFQKALHGAAAVFAPQGGDHAVGAVVVASLRDAEIRIPGGRGQDASPVLGGGVDVAQVAGPQAGASHHLVNGGADVPVAAGAQDAVHLRQLVQNVLLVPLGHATGDQDLLYLAGPLQLRHLQNVVDGLLAGGLQEAAGVHHHHVGPLRLGLDGMAGGLDRGHHLLAVHLILGAAQGDKGNVIWHDRVLQSMDCCKMGPAGPACVSHWTGNDSHDVAGQIRPLVGAGTP